MSTIILKDESYKIIGIGMDVHRELGMGFKEAVYKEALELEITNQDTPYEREKLFRIEYKGKILKHKYPADFIVFSQLIFQVKAATFIVDSFVAQTINYLKASGLSRHCRQVWSEVICSQKSRLLIRVIRIKFV